MTQASHLRPGMWAAGPSLSAKLAWIILEGPHGAQLHAVDEHGWSPMHVAATLGDGDAIRTLAAWGPPIDIPSAAGMTPLTTAVHHDQIAAVEALIDLGDPIDRMEDGQTALHLSMRHSNGLLTCRLIELRADVDRPNADHQSPLLLALLHRNTDSINKLLDAGADPLAPQGWPTALDQARKSSHPLREAHDRARRSPPSAADSPIGASRGPNRSEPRTALPLILVPRHNRAMDHNPATPAAPNAATLATLALTRQIVALGDVDDDPFQTPARDAFASAIEGAIWGWAKESPLEVRRLAETLLPAFQAGDLLRLAGFCLVASAHFDHGSARLPFETRTQPAFPTAAAHPIEGRPSPWADRKRATLAKGGFGSIVQKVVRTHDELRPVLSADETLSLYERALAAGSIQSLPPRARPAEWRTLHGAVEQAGLPSEIELSSAIPELRSPRSPSL